MGSSSKDLLRLEHKNSTMLSSLESALLVCTKDSQSQTKIPSPLDNPITTPVAQSQVLGKVREFLGVMSEANRRLEQEAKLCITAEDNSCKFDIEVFTGNESGVIEMDLMLGIADLHAPEAVAAAEAAITGSQPAILVAAGSNETESEDKSDDDESDNQEDAVESDDGASEDFNNGNDDDNKQGFHSKAESSRHGQDGSNEAVRNNRLKMRPKIVEMFYKIRFG